MAAPFEGMASVNVCPKDQNKVQVAAKRLRCNNDTHGNSQYMCIPNEEKTSLVEFCFDGIMGLEDKGVCLENSSGKVTRHNCSSFSSGCPNVTFRKSDFFNYPACQNINTNHRCYVSDPSCPLQKPDEQTSSLSTSVAIAAPVTTFLIIIIAAIALYIFCRRKVLKTEKYRRTKNDYHHVTSDEKEQDDKEKAQADKQNGQEKAQADERCQNAEDLLNGASTLEQIYKTDTTILTPGPVVNTPENAAKIELSMIETINETRIDWNFVMKALTQNLKEKGENYKNIDDLLNDALTLEQNSKTHTTTLNPGPVADTPKNIVQFEFSTIETITDMSIDWNEVMQAIMKKKKETDENYPNITKLVDDTMDLEEKSEAPATHSNSGPVGDISKNTVQFELSTIKTITDMSMNWNDVMQAIIKKKKDTGEINANLDDLLNEVLNLVQHSGTKTTPSSREVPTAKKHMIEDQQFLTGMQ